MTKRPSDSATHEHNKEAKRSDSYGKHTTPLVILSRRRRIWPTNKNNRKIAKMYEFYVYIMTNKSGTLYVGVTNNILKRVHQHKSGLINGFTKKYKITRLLYYETFRDAYSAISREKSFKGWMRKKKLDLIGQTNPDWQDIAAEWYVQ